MEVKLDLEITIDPTCQKPLDIPNFHACLSKTIFLLQNSLNCLLFFMFPHTQGHNLFNIFSFILCYLRLYEMSAHLEVLKERLKIDIIIWS